METAQARFSSLDRSYSCRVLYRRPDRYRDLLGLPRDGHFIARGAGLSYVPASFAADAASICMERFDRVLAFDPAAGRVEVEAGLSIGRLHEFLSRRGLHLPVQPGHPRLSVGGCIALDVHGKDPKAGLFHEWVDSLTVYHPARGLVSASRGENAELFELTCGGLGLTGIIVAAALRAAPFPSTTVEVRHVATGSLLGAVDTLRRLSVSSRWLYGWLDLSRPCSPPFRGFVAGASFVAEEGGHDGVPEPAMSGIRLPLFGRVTLAAFNPLYRAWKTGRPPARVPFHRFAYPAAGLSAYFGMFGADGFVERQMLIPWSVLPAYAAGFEALLARHRPVIALATLKILSGQGRWLRYAGDGVSLTLDIVGRGERGFHESLDGLNKDCAVLDNPAKDSRLTREAAQAEYPGFSDFERRLRAFDPARQFHSAVSRRLGL